MEPLTLLPDRSIESVFQGIEKFRLMFTLEGFCQCIQDHFCSIGSGHVLWFQSIAGNPGWACRPASNSWSLQLIWGTREKRPQFQFLSITLELSRLGGGSVLCLLGSNPRDSTSTAVNSSSSKSAFIFAVNAPPFRQRATPRFRCDRNSFTRI